MFAKTLFYHPHEPKRTPHSSTSMFTSGRIIVQLQMKQYQTLKGPLSCTYDCEGSILYMDGEGCLLWDDEDVANMMAL